MRPSHKVRKLGAKALYKKLSPGHRYAKIKLDEACPKGTVPVLRVADKDQLKNVSNLNKSRFFPNGQWNHGLEVSELYGFLLFNVCRKFSFFFSLLYFCNAIRVFLYLME